MREVVMAQPENREAIDAAARILGLDVPELCHEGIAANLVLLQTHFAVVTACPAEEGLAE
jgi:hypothetical protein